MDKPTVIATLEHMAVLLELKGENPFKSRAYLNAARALRESEEDIHALASAGRLREIRGIGAGIAAHVEDVLTTGHSSFFDELAQAMPATLLDLLKVPGLGPKKVRLLYEKLGIATLGELEAACRNDQLATLDGFGAKTQEKVLAGLAIAQSSVDAFRADNAQRDADSVLAALAQTFAGGGVTAVTSVTAVLAGSLRRGREVVHDIDIVVAVNGEAAAAAVAERFCGMEDATEVLARGATKCSLRLGSGMQADLRIVAGDELPFALHYFTGSKEHNTQMRARAKERGMKLNEYGLFREGEAESLPCRSEAEIFAALGLPDIPPELREGEGEIEAAERGELPVLVELGDLRGAFHVHSTWSDGKDSLEDMVAAASAAGWQYVGISDHSQAAHYAGGLKPEAVARQREAIERLRERHPEIRIFHGSEVDILADGALDYGEKILAGFDFVVGSVHVRGALSAEQMTDRVVTAVRSPLLTILGHPTGRLLLKREPYPIDLPRVVAAAAEHGVAVEINANPRRLDLDWRHVRALRGSGARFAIDPDAHSVRELELRYGVAAARKGWLSAGQVVNTMDAEAVTAWLEARRARL